ncbi:MAG: arylsulfotransferase family protein [Solirubrobacteraceae bacterium]
MGGLLLTAGFAIALAAPAGASAGGLHVIPFPGTPDAASSSRIIFSSLSPSDLRSVRVIGSRSGRHRGRLVALPSGAGTAFAPGRPFASGERVQVAAALRSQAAGRVSGEPGRTQLHFSFRVAVPGAGPSASAIAARDIGTSSGPNMHFRSQVHFHPPLVRVGSDPDSSSGDMFLTPHNGSQNGPMILDSTGHLIWFQPLDGVGAFNLENQSYNGQPVLTWWQGTLINGHGARGEDMIMNSSYRPVAVLKAGNGYTSDLHEFQITPRGTALIDAYVPVHYNLAGVHGSRHGTVLDCVIQELNISTGKVLWEWHALGHIRLRYSYKAPSGSRTFDPYHLNSIQETSDGNFLISLRNTWAVYKIKKSTGNVIWTLGGKHSSFKMAPRTNFEWQHDARIFPREVLTLFNDAALPQKESQSSAMKLQINTRTNTVSLTRRYTHSPPVLTGGEGNMQTLPNGNVFVGWGSSPEFSEYTSSGRQIFSGSFLIPINSYRAYRFPWTGHPTTRPSLALAPQSNGNLKVYASWNGATQVARWKVLGGAARTTLGWFDTRGRTGFETVSTLHSEPRYLAVQALDSGGNVLATSPAHRDPAHVAIFGPEAFVPTSGGYGAIPVGCFTGHDCHIALKINSGSSVIAHGSQSVTPATGRLVYFTLSSAGQSRLAHSSSHRLPVQVSIRDSSGAKASTSMTLIPYTISGPAPPQSVSQSPTIQIARTNSFVSSSGLGSILSACYAPTACHPNATVSMGGTVIGTTRRTQHLGTQELGDVFFQLNQTGQSMLAHAPGNQLGAQIKLTNGGATATGQIDLIRYS